jgi:hypothetical protein
LGLSHQTAIFVFFLPRQNSSAIISPLLTYKVTMKAKKFGSDTQRENPTIQHKN